VSGTQSLSLREVAFRAGVATSSVSRVLSGHPDVSPAMRARVMAVVDALGYEPDLLAASFRRGSTMSVAVVVPDVADPFTAAVVGEAERRLREAGYVTVIASSDGSARLDADHVHLFRRRRADGLLLALSGEADPATLDELRSLQAPYVLLDCEAGDAPDASAVLSDHAAAAELAIGQLAALGHRRVALVSAPGRLRPTVERRRGFESACARLGVAAVVPDGDPGGEIGENAVMRLLSASPRPTAVVSGSVGLLPGIVGAVRARGLRIPADVSLVAPDDAPGLELADPPVAALSREPLAVGREAARLLLDRIAGAAPETVVVAPRLVLRESCGPAPSA
jgi:LacI family transcriptional regulator